MIPTIRTFVAAACLTCASIAAQATTFLGPTPYLSFADSPYNGGSFSYFHLEDMEHGFTAPGVTSSGGVITGPGGLTDSVDGDDGVIDGSGTNGHSMFGDGSTGITFTFDAGTLGTLPTHVGLVWTDGAYYNQVTFQAWDSANVSLGTVVGNNIGDGSFLGGTAEDRFFGVVNAGGISKIRMWNSQMTGGGSGIEVDHLQYGASAVPLPAAAWLFGSGLLGLTGMARRKQVMRQ
ncbi:MAG: VPLPA-CTERM sorting domain-containing protein [Gammaproteobacteria bacterium]